MIGSIDFIVRKEDTNINPGERRTPLLPEDITSYNHLYETWDDRIISGANQGRCPGRDVPLVFGIKPCPSEWISAGQTHLMFAHVIKGQRANMPLLRRFLETMATLIDYECLRSNGRRLIGFGYYAGLAGTIEGLIGLNRARELMGYSGYIPGLCRYETHDQFKLLVRQLEVNRDLKILVVGSGQVAAGAIEVCEVLKLKKSKSVGSLFQESEASYAILPVRDIIMPLDPSLGTDYQEYLQKGSALYSASLKPTLEKGKLSLLVHGAYWDKKYPKLLANADLSFLHGIDRLPEMIADITCDPGGSFDCTTRDSSLDEPFYEYDINKYQTHCGLTKEPERVRVMAVSNLPSLFPLDASRRFSDTLKNLLPELISFSKGEISYGDLSSEINQAVIVYKGELTAPFKYLQSNL